jgi:O-antigen/teichoic acid export membrane protein
VISGALFSLLIVLSAGVIGDILGNQAVVPVLPWMSLLVVLGALTRIPEGLLEKDMAFKKLSAIMIVTDLTYIATAIALALLGYGLWSLVFAFITKFVVSLVMSWTMTPGWDWITPKPWDRRLMRELLGYGVNAMGSRTVYFFFTNADNFVVGRQLGAAALGVYAKAFDFTTKTVDSLNKTISTVLFPSYSKIQHDRERLSRGYLKSLRMIATVTVPLAAGIAVTAPELVPVVLGNKWLAMIPILQILACMSIVKPISSTTAAVFNAMGHPGYNMRAGLVVTAVMLPAIFLLLFMGAEGVALAVFIAHVAGLIFNVYQIHTLLPGTASRMLGAVAPTAAGTAAMAAGVHLAKAPLSHLTGGLATWGTLAGSVVIGAVIYVGMLIVFQRPLLEELKTLVIHREERSGR